MKIYLASDHAGFALKERVKEVLLDEGYEIEDCVFAARGSNDSYSINF